MAKRISMATKRELVAEVGRRYRAAGGVAKRRILDEFVALTGYHRKHALRLLNGAQACYQGSGRPRSRIYDEAVHEALIIIWESADRICSKRLKALMPILVGALERHGHLALGAELRELLLGISAATIDRLLAPQRADGAGRRRRRSNGLLRSQIPVCTFADWGDPPPGMMEVDLVAHNGGNSAGSCVHTLVLTDIASGWTECVPLLVREQGLVVEGVERARGQLPFALLGLDTDNDGVFINESLITYAKDKGLTQTRSRAYRKNDQAWVEQKNGAVVRRLVGHGRLQGVKAAQMLSRLYSVSRLYVNCFQPSFKLKEKRREGAKVTKHYHPPATPCQRLLASEHLGDNQKQTLGKLATALDPLRLLHAIRSAQSALARLSAPNAPTEECSGDNELALFLAQLPTLWRGGDARPTHRQPPPAPRHWRTRPDPFAAVWSEVERWLMDEPDATGKSLFQRLQTEHPSTYAPGQLRTLQRRVREWRRAMARKLIFGGANPEPGSFHNSVPNITETAMGAADSVPGNISS